jgi:hypothetical protein
MSTVYITLVNGSESIGSDPDATSIVARAFKHTLQTNDVVAIYFETYPDTLGGRLSNGKRWKSDFFGATFINKAGDVVFSKRDDCWKDYK